MVVPAVINIFFVLEYSRNIELRFRCKLITRYTILKSILISSKFQWENVKPVNDIVIYSDEVRK